MKNTRKTFNTLEEALWEFDKHYVEYLLKHKKQKGLDGEDKPKKVKKSKSVKLD